MTYDPEKHHRRSLRLPDCDYSQGGAYFVTLCTFNRECLFGEISNDEMKLNDYGVIVLEEWLKTPIVRPSVELDEFIIMPNHLHGILVLHDADSVGATRRVAQSEKQTSGPKSGSIGAIIGQFKAVTTKRVNSVRQASGAPVWQRNYYEHVIRNEKSLNEIREYILNNPVRWPQDKENPNYIDGGRPAGSPLYL